MPPISSHTGVRLAALTLVALLAAPVGARLLAQDAAALRAQVEAFQQSLKTAWDAGDRDAVLSHFEHGDLLPPTPAQYSMLGRFPFWDRPLASVTRNDDGSLSATFVMDPESDSPAVRMAFTLVGTANGGLQVKSSMTPDQVALARRRLRERHRAEDLTSAVAAAVATRPSFDSTLLPVFEEGFWKQIEQQAAAAGQTVPQEMRDGLRIRPLGEVYAGDKAVLLTLMGIAEGGDVDPLGAGFQRDGDRWAFDATLPLRSRRDLDRFLGEEAPIRIVRAPGLTVEELPAFYQHARTELRAQYEAAEGRGDTERLMGLVEQAMAGRPLLHLWDVATELQFSPGEPATVRLGRQQLEDTEGLISIEVLDEDGDVDELLPLKVVREGDGWVIAGPYETPSDQTQQLFDSLGYALRDFKDANGSYPQAASLDELLTTLRAVAPERELGTTDAWGTPIRYVRSEDGATYRLISAGADMEFDHGDWDPAPTRTRDMESLDPDEDIVHENGRFVRWHKRGIW